jgi:hypothetical protein
VICDYQVAQTLTITELSEHQSKEFIPASEVFDILVTIILADKIVEAIPIKECRQQNEYELVLEHMQSMIIGCKITKSSPLTRKNARKRLYFNYFKERLVHFKGTILLAFFVTFALKYGDENKKTSTAF